MPPGDVMMVVFMKMMVTDGCAIILVSLPADFNQILFCLLTGFIFDHGIHGSYGSWVVGSFLTTKDHGRGFQSAPRGLNCNSPGSGPALSGRSPGTTDPPDICALKGAPLHR